ncbi:DUF6331 family protein [Micromonospora sp. NPDC005189]
MAEVSVEIPSPLSKCIIFCEVECVSGCCGIDAGNPCRLLVPSEMI